MAVVVAVTTPRRGRAERASEQAAQSSGTQARGDDQTGQIDAPHGWTILLLIFAESRRGSDDRPKRRRWWGCFLATWLARVAWATGAAAVPAWKDAQQARQDREGNRFRRLKTHAKVGPHLLSQEPFWETEDETRKSSVRRRLRVRDSAISSSKLAA